MLTYILTKIRVILKIVKIQFVGQNAYLVQTSLVVWMLELTTVHTDIFFKTLLLGLVEFLRKTLT